MIKTIFLTNSFDVKSKVKKILFLISILFITTVCLDLLIEGNLYPDNIYEIHNFSYFRFWWILGIISLFGCGIFVKTIFTNSKFDEENIHLKIFVLLSLPISFIFITISIITWDISCKLSFEDNAKYFTEIICNDNFSYIIENKDRICSESYCKKITNQYLNS